ncbi:DNA-binding transcriptional MerR regulator [Planomicrobium stackebrandtii]|uniref:DNA-binding transcriptional MerR regulator n=1 Tax=Planomicrobium stackebrandtii TaxID=253160 RepID=A0ABU0H1R7_9BACL|nr:MerR family transcriptional regulator [Planomicrobium stackebrandtii]MDQ0430720.1 DNA-binding transcriptional MerR regulator [Planomicrobium stackebrandtii]
MEYTIQKLGNLTGISTRTLRYYDEIDLLKPARKSSAGYRIYSQQEVDKLQHILFYRELGLELEQIKTIVNDSDFDYAEALEEHRKKLIAKRMQLDLLITNVEKTISAKKGESTMADKEKFEGFKQKLVDDNEQQYGSEIRSEYGDELVDQSNAKMLNMSEEQYQEFTRLEQRVLASLADAVKTGDPSSDAAQQTADLHRQWLGFTWPSYSKEAHKGLAEMYVADERFAAYYDKAHPGAAQFLRDAIVIYTQQE